MSCFSYGLRLSSLLLELNQALHQQLMYGEHSATFSVSKESLTFLSLLRHINLYNRAMSTLTYISQAAKCFIIHLQAANTCMGTC